MRVRKKLYRHFPTPQSKVAAMLVKIPLFRSYGAWLKTPAQYHDLPLTMPCNVHQHADATAPSLCQALLLTVCGCERQSCADAAVQHPARARPGAALQPGACLRMLQDGDCSACVDE